MGVPRDLSGATLPPTREKGDPAMVDAATVLRHLSAYRSGHSLPQAFYTSDALFEADLDAVFGVEWLFACNESEVRAPGDYLTLEIGRDSIIVVRGRDGEVRAFHNVCRHRGSRVCLEERGHANRLVCPYHQWVYELDGTLRNARQMPADFDKLDYGLKPVRVETICGLVYISLADDPPDLSRYREAITPFLAPHQPWRTRVAHAETIIEEANWKLVIENNRECYHCAAGHPELLVTFHETPLAGDAKGEARFREMMAPKAARWDALDLPYEAADGGDEFRCVRLPLNEGALSFTMDGRLACGKLLGDLADPDLGSVRMFRAPNNWNHFLADHILHFRVTPIAPDRTAVRTTWLVHEDAVEGVDYEVERLVHVWRETNAQDARLAATNHLGVASRAYEPGPYAPSEAMLTQFADWYARRLADRYGPAPAMRVAAE